MSTQIAVYILSFMGLSAMALVVLSWMILKVGAALSDCPVTGRAARAGALTIVTGYAAIGAGAAVLASAIAISAIEIAPFEGFLAALGVVVMCLGIGFGHAVRTLREAVAVAAAQAKSMPA